MDHCWSYFLAVVLPVERLASFETWIQIKLAVPHSNLVELREIVEAQQCRIHVVQVAYFPVEPSFVVAKHFVPV